MFTFLHQTDKFIITGDMAAHTFWQWSDDIKPEDDITPYDGTALLGSGSEEDNSSVTVQCWGSGMFIPDPGFYPGSWFFIHPGFRSRIYRITLTIKEEGGKIGCFTFFLNHKFTKFKIILISNWTGSAKNLSQLDRIIVFFPKIVSKLAEIWVGNPGSGKKPIPDADPEVKKALNRNRVRNTGSVFLCKRAGVNRIVSQTASLCTVFC